MEANNPYLPPNPDVAQRAFTSPPLIASVDLSSAVHAVGVLSAPELRRAGRLAKHEGAERIVPAMLVLFAAMYAYHHLGDFWHYPIAAAATFVCVLLLAWLGPKNDPLSRGQEYLDAMIGEAGVEFRGAHVVWTVDWRVFKGYKITKDLLLLGDGKVFIPFSKRQFHSESDWQRFVEIVGAKLPCFYSRRGRDSDACGTADGAAACSEHLFLAHHDDTRFELAFACVPERNDVRAVVPADTLLQRLKVGALLILILAVLLWLAAIGIMKFFEIINRPQSRAAALGCATGLVCVAFVLAIRKFTRPRALQSETRFWRVGQDAIQFSTELAKHTYSWRFFESWQSSPDAVVLRRGNSMWLFPRRCLEPDAWSRLKQIAADKMGASAGPAIATPD